jgi:dipeptidyl aminopeptidase/acylaminoacyl peptidase
MKIFKRILKILGITLLVIVIIIGSIAGSLHLMNKGLVMNNVAETKEKFGAFESGQLIKTRKVGGIKKGFLSMVGLILPKRIIGFHSRNHLINVNTYTIAYKSDGLIVTGIMVTPKRKGKYPCIIYNRGGNRDYSQLSIFQTMFRLSPLAKEGYVVIASQYRGNAGGEGVEEFGGKDVNDVLNLIPALSQVPMADTSRIGMFGPGRGGMMAYKVLKTSDQIKAAVITFGVSNLFMLKADRPEMEKYVYSQLIPNYKDNIEESLRDRSAVYWADSLCKSTPLLIFHSTTDPMVNYMMAKELADSLAKYDHPFVFVSVKDDKHILTENFDTVRKRAIRWFDTYLRDMEPFNEPNQRMDL